MQIIRVLLPQLQLPALDYLAPKDTALGELIIIPFRSGQMVGVVCEINVVSELKNIREIASGLGTKISEKQLDFVFKAAKYYMVEPGSVAKLMLPVDPVSSGVLCHREEDPKGLTSRSHETYLNSRDHDVGLHPPRDDVISSLPPLSPSQAASYETILSHSGVSVLHGVTGSGKTEVYFHLIADIIKQGKQALLMLPEIALSSQIIDRFTQRFGFKPDVWNSAVTPAKKRKLFARILSGEAGVIIGTRSSLFLPYKDLGLIIVDEEHDASYKQESGVMYNARDMAVLRSSIFGHSVVLGSATPSIETLHNANLGKYKLIKLEDRFGGATMPEVKVVDMRLQKMEKGTWISPDLKRAMAAELGFGNQVMLFLNRRGYAPLLLCSSCGHRVICRSCSSWMVMHKRRKRLECHHCGQVAAIKITCPECSVEDSLVACGPGVERIAEEAAQSFQGARIQLMTKEEMSTERAISDIIQKIENQEVDIIVGTQVITKGYHFPKLSLVGVIDADIGLRGGDLKSTERVFQLLHQVGGRAGREGAAGKVYLQTYDPESQLIKQLEQHAFDEFVSGELDSREVGNMPPFARMASVLLSGKGEDRVQACATNLVRFIPRHEAIRVMGPVPAMMSKLQDKHRYRLLVIADKRVDIQAYVKQWLDSYKIPSYIHIKVDIDPYSFY